MHHFSNDYPVTVLQDMSEPDEIQGINTGRIVVSVFDCRNQDGDLCIALFNDKTGFPGKVELACKKGGLHEIGEQNVFTFDNVPYGTYAIAVMHDENRSGCLHTNFLGIPKEGVGASNNPHFMFGPPSYDNASFELNSAETAIDIHLKYL